MSNGYKTHDRYYLLKRKVSFEEYKELRRFPLVRLGKNASGFIDEVRSVRLNPYQLLAYRTIGLDRENAQKVGLEQTYDTLLKGITGQRLVRYIAGGVAVPVEDDYQVEPENGKDIVTTIDTRIQEITENALMKMMISNEAEHGCAIVMEVKTGAIKAIANLGRRPNGMYWEDFNYAMTPTEPGSTFKLATLLSVLEDKKVSLNSAIDLNNGTWQINGRTVYDAEQHGVYVTNVKRAFELSSNVGMAKLAYSSYASTPARFINHLKNLELDSLTGIDLYGERKPVMYKPGSRYWSATTLPWMAFGGGGHSRGILEKLNEDGRLIAFDQDADVQQNLLTDDRVIFVPHNFRHLQRFLRLYKHAKVDGVLADLGVSSHQFDKGERGFSTRFNGPLDMRMDQRQQQTAANILLTYSEPQLHKMFEQYGEVTNSKTLAKHIVQHRKQASLKTINEFKTMLQPVIKGNPNKYLAQVFQALRIEVNDEIGALKEMLQQIPHVLKSSGRAVIITFHSIEDRLVKIFFKQGSFEESISHPFEQQKQNELKIITKKPILPSDEELKKNSRARSAKMRVAEKL